MRADTFVEKCKRIEATPVGKLFVAAGFQIDAMGGRLAWLKGSEGTLARITDAESGLGMTEDGSDVWSVLIYDGVDLLDATEVQGAAAAILAAGRWL